MKFDLNKPCPKCPFRVDCLKGWLGEERAEEIIESIITQQKTFSCHNTNKLDDETGEIIETKNSQHCAGALIFLEKLENPNQLTRIAERLGLYNKSEMDMNSPVFNNKSDFIKHHSGI